MRCKPDLSCRPTFCRIGYAKDWWSIYSGRQIFSYKFSKDMLPGAMASMVSKQSHNYSTRGARSNFFVCHSDGRSIRSIAPRYWNSLSGLLKESASIAVFKEKSKSDLLAPYNSFTCTTRNCRSCASSNWYYSSNPFYRLLYLNMTIINAYAVLCISRFSLGYG